MGRPPADAAEGYIIWLPPLSLPDRVPPVSDPPGRVVVDDDGPVMDDDPIPDEHPPHSTSASPIVTSSHRTVRTSSGELSQGERRAGRVGSDGVRRYTTAGSRWAHERLPSPTFTTGPGDAGRPGDPIPDDLAPTIVFER
jgi:hypothetical protein